MIVTQLELTNFRSYEKLQLDFGEGLHVFAGPNGAGKTNIVEAIHFLSLARSFRTPKDELLLRRGSEFGAIRATVRAGNRVRKIAIGLSPNGKKILVNDKPITRLSELSELVNVLVFEPRDVLLFEDLPRARRQFLDIALIKQENGYLEALTRYEKILRERNEILKQERVNHTQLDVITNQLVEASLPLVIGRAAYLEKINGVIEKIVKSIKLAPVGIKLHYRPYVKPSSEFVQEALALYEKSKDIDIRRKLTNIGVHREDFRIDLDNSDVADFGSQGENRLLAIALKLSPYFIIEDKDDRPIIVLDDVLSELDPPSQERLLQFLTKFDQVFITTTKYSKNYGVVYDVGHQKAQRRSAHGI